MKRKFLICSLLFIISACAVRHSAPAIRPESLINSSSEKISFPITDSSSIPAIENWLDSGDAPSSAEVSCADGDACNLVKNLLARHHVSFNESQSIDSNTGSVSLNYNRVIARECTTTNFGCATSVNSIHMVTNRDQFIKPAISDLHDAASAVKAVNKYVK